MPEEEQPKRRPDASMSLLADLFAEDALDPGYARAATTNRPTRRGVGAVGVFAMLALAGLLVAVAGLQVRRHEPAAVKERQRLIAEIHDRTAQTDELQRRMEAVRAQTERARTAALARSAAGQRARQDLARVADAAAATERTGRGITVTVDDGRPAGDDMGGTDLGRVYDQDLQILVNGLWEAGAVAIGVNGQRLTSTTAIRAAGDAILVDYRPLTPPYKVTALGGDGLRDAFAASAAEQHFRTLRDQFGMRFDVHKEHAARLPAAVALRLHYAQEATHR
ncbi:MAG TPA: DUF881 domain-containing protein [Streptosporangiaceae bacterium]|jgi:uncharacterized protein YlxW (UPF0749 family)